MGNGALVESSEEVREMMAAQATSVSLERLLHGIHGFNLAAGLRGISWQSSLPLELAFVETLSIESGEIQNPSPASRPTSEADINNPISKTEKKPEVSAEPKPVILIDPSSDISFDLILDRWRDILQSARRHDPRAQALLNSCRPLGLDADTLVIGFGSDLLREKMEKGHNISVAMDALREILGKEISLRCVLSDLWADGLENESQPAPMKDGGMVSTAVRDLGAQVVDVEQLPPDA
jgi:hypothetical protein